jgi:hypothetical protein
LHWSFEHEWWQLTTTSAQVNNFTFHYAFYVVMNWLPTYFDHVLRANLADLGAVKTLPYLIMFAMSNVGNACGDWLIGQRKWTVAAARKAVNTTGVLLHVFRALVLHFREICFGRPSWQVRCLPS